MQAMLILLVTILIDIDRQETKIWKMCAICHLEFECDRMPEIHMHHFIVHTLNVHTLKHEVTLCAYAQQGYAFGHVGLCICVYTIIMWPKNCLRSYCLKFSCWCNLLLTHRV